MIRECHIIEMTISVSICVEIAGDVFALHGGYERSCRRTVVCLYGGRVVRGNQIRLV